MTWRQFVMNLGTLDPDQVESALSDCGAISVTFTDAGDNPVLEPAPGETPLWEDTRVTALFSAGTDLEGLETSLAKSLDVSELPPSHVEDLADRAWEREWLRDFGPMQFGNNLWVVPNAATPPDPDAVVIRLDPGLAFGTGTHPTTALCLEWLGNTVVPGQSVFDFGCGSGILSVAAAMLGATEVRAVDIDLQALSATRQNAANNGVEDRLAVSNDTDLSGKTFSIVVANILAGTLVDNVDLIRDAVEPGGKIALSGILTSQVGDVTDTYRRHFDLDDPVFLQEWTLVSGTRN